jgi:hypothetical protein
MNQEIIDLYDEYTHKPLSRTEFMSRLACINRWNGGSIKYTTYD